MDCPQCYSSLETGAAQCPFCGWNADVSNDVDQGLRSEDSRSTQNTSPASSPDAAEWVAHWRAQFEERRVLVPAELFEQARELMSRAQRQMRVATVLFADLKGFSAESKLHHPTAIDTVLAEFARLTTETSLLHGGFVIGFAGDGALLVFGAPVAFDRDSENAVAAALEIRRRVQTLHWPGGTQLSLRVGMATGQMLATVQSSGSSSTYTVIGHAVNLAARLEQNAAPGQILVCESTRRLVQSRFLLEPTAPLVLKNIARDYIAWSVAGERAAVPPPAEAAPPFVGRETELSRTIQAVLQPSTRDIPQILIEGERGIGKTRLLQEVAARLHATHHSVLLEATPVGRHFLFQPLIHWLRTELGLTRAHDVAAVEQAIALYLARITTLGIEDGTLIGYLFGLPEATLALRAAAPERVREALFRLFLQCLRAAGGSRSLLLIFDDVQWLDDATLAWRQWLLEQHPADVTLIHLCHDPGATSVANEQNLWTMRMRLQGLNDKDSNELIAHLWPKDVDALSAGRAGGNPLFLAELARWHGAAENSLAEAGARNLPESLMTLVQWRLDQLQGGARLVLQCSAVIGHTFARRTLEGVDLQGSDLPAELEQLNARALLVEWSADPSAGQAFRGLRFQHAIVRDVTYDTLLPDQRCRLHAKVARSIQDEAGTTISFEQCDSLAWHLSEAGERDKALYWLMKGAERAHQVGAYDETLRRCRRALELLDSTSQNQSQGAAGGVQRLRLLLRMGRVEVTLGQHNAAKESLRQATEWAEQLNNAPGRAESMAWSGVLALNHGEGDRARELLDQALASADELNLAHLQASCLAALGVLEFQQARMRQAGACFERLTALGESHHCAAWQGDALNNWALTAWKGGRYEESIELFTRALPQRRATGDLAGLAATLMNIGILHEQLGRDEEAMDHYEQARVLATRIGHRRCLAAIQINEANLLRVKDEPRASLEKSAEAIVQAARLGDRRLESVACDNFAQAALLLSMWDEARCHARRAKDLVRGGADAEALLSARLTACELRLAVPRIHCRPFAERNLQVLTLILREIEQRREALGELEPRVLTLKSLLLFSIRNLPGEASERPPSAALQAAREAADSAGRLHNVPLQHLVQRRLRHILDTVD